MSSGTLDELDAIRDRRLAFYARQGFELDAFQQRALDSLDDGASLLVSAPTGSGKTLVADYGVQRALDLGTKAFYTTPLKALSNQKYLELKRQHGAERVGLLTGDTSQNASADIVVMTTEVLRNMLLNESAQLKRLGLVVLDEVHFLQDPYRGGVWEEVIIMTSASVQFVCLSATVSNASVLGEWIATNRGRTDVIIERERPITLHNHVAVTPRATFSPELFDLLQGDRVSDYGLRIDQSTMRRRGAGATTWRGAKPGPNTDPYKTPRRSELIALLDDEALLPAIWFIFSRAACDDAAKGLLRDGVRLTKSADRNRIRGIVEAQVEMFTDDELDALGYDDWLEQLEAGIAAHHAGMVPAFREAVETLFSEGLLKVVFATETLSLGINMPARTVVMDRFTKYGGSGRATLTSGEFAQMSGRAGRRGLDDEGHAVVVFAGETPISEVARVATAPPPELHSSFRPTYNLTSNLVHRYSRERARQILDQTYAQFEARRRGAQANTGDIAAQFDRRLGILEELGYLDGWQLTERGLLLEGLYHESDLLLAEVIEAGFLDGLEPALIAGALSALVFEPRHARVAPPTNPKKVPKRAKGALPDRLGGPRQRELKERTELIVARSEALHVLETHHKIPRSKKADGGIATAIASWARGAPLGVVLDVARRDIGDVAAGDFVRIAKQVADLCEQVSYAQTHPDLMESATEARGLIVRSVVAAGGLEVSANQS